MWNESIYTVLLNASLATILLVFSAFTLTYKDAVWAKLARVAVAPFTVLALLKIGFWGTEQNKYFRPLVSVLRGEPFCSDLQGLLFVLDAVLHDGCCMWYDHADHRPIPYKPL